MKKLSVLSIFIFIGLNATYAFKDPSLAALERAIVNSLDKESYKLQYEISSKAPGTNGVMHYYGFQTFDKLPIYQSSFNAVLKNDSVVYLNQSFKVNISDIPKTSFSLSPSNAISAVANVKSDDQHIQLAESNGLYTFSNISLSYEDIKVQKLWVVSATTCKAAYEVSIYEKDHSHWYNTRVDAESGEIISRNDWVTECLFDSHNQNSSKDNNLDPLRDETFSKNNKAAGGTYTVFAMPTESPNHGSRTNVTGAEDEDASPFGWHDINGQTGPEFTITRGNNVHASEDKNADNQPGTSVDGGSALVFNNPFDISKSAALYTDAAITNLFYWNNLLHDVWWHYGFEEQSGNFQQNNYGNGGVGGDYVNADAQDGSGTNNANFATPPDGTNPRMQMFIWNNSNGPTDYFSVKSPSSIAGKYTSRRALFGPTLDAVPITGNLVLVDDGSTEGDKGCNSLTNASAIKGNIALVRRRDCNFTIKVKNAQDAGAKAVVIFSDDDANLIDMGGSDNTITIPSLMISLTDGQDLIDELNNNTVNVSLYDSTNAGANVFDSDLDNGIISHEYGHGISIRLTGGALNSSCLSNQEQMGEGWSDFFGLVMTHESGDKGTDSRGIGTYARNQPITGPGIRPFPYSTDVSISRYTYENIKTFSVPHGVGSVWCSMLWDLYWAMIDKHGYDSDIYKGTGGNNKAIQLVIDGLKIQPCNPGFIDGRDAIIEADKLNNNGENEALIWEVFAARGLGFYANQGSSNDRTDGVSDFEIPPYLDTELIVEKSAEDIIDNDSILTYKLKVLNKTVNTSKDITLTDVISDNYIIDKNSLDCGATYSNGSITWFIDSLVSGDSITCSFNGKVVFREVSDVIWFDSAEVADGRWTIESALGNNGWEVSTTRRNTGSSSWFVANEDSQTDYSLISELDLTQMDNPIFTFSHWYHTEEAWDGGVVEIREEGGDWIDAGEYFIANGYNQTISTNQQSTISDRTAFSGNSGQFIQSRINLSSFNGGTIDLRFRFSSDGAASEEGWYIDDIELIDAEVLSNTLNVTYGDNGESGSSTANTIVLGEASTFGLGIYTIEDKDVKIYPVPTKNTLNIEFNNATSFDYQLTSINGQDLQSGTGEERVTLNLHGYSPAVYILTIQQNGANHTYKIVVEE